MLVEMVPLAARRTGPPKATFAPTFTITAATLATRALCACAVTPSCSTAAVSDPPPVLGGLKGWTAGGEDLKL